MTAEHAWLAVFAALTAAALISAIVAGLSRDPIGQQNQGDNTEKPEQRERIIHR